MGVVGAVNTPNVQRALREAQCSAKLMVVAEGAPIWDARKGLKGALRFVKAMVVGNDAHQKDAARVFTGVLYFALTMAGVRGVQCLNVPKARGDAQIIASGMVVVKGASLKDAQRVHKEVQIFARHTVEEKDAPGDIWAQVSVVMALFHVISLQGESLASVLPIVYKCKKKKPMVTLHWVRQRKAPVLVHLHRRMTFLHLELEFPITEALEQRR